MTKMKWNGIKDQIILNKIALYFGLQYNPSSGAEEELVTTKMKKNIIRVHFLSWTTASL